MQCTYKVISSILKISILASLNFAGHRILTDKNDELFVINFGCGKDVQKAF